MYSAINAMSKKRDNKSRKRVLLAISGGVDSSVAAFLLKERGYEVVGTFMKFWNVSGSRIKSGMTNENKCCSMESMRDAREVMRRVGGRLYTIDYRDLFKGKVVDPFLLCYSKGLTPNPCINCNKFVKLGAFYKKAEELGCDYVATGHYARVEKDASGFKLLESVDKTKDQSYFLYTLDQAKLSKTLFPIGNLKKAEVFKLAKKFELPVAERKESQEICFVPGKTHYDFLKHFLRGKFRPGPIIFKGREIGEHAGLPLYTIGQRKGIKIGGIGPFYVLRADYKTNKLFVTDRANDPELYSDSMSIRNVHWISGKQSKFPLNCKARIRYGHKKEPVVINCANSKSCTDAKSYRDAKSCVCTVKFKKSQRAVTPGQTAVFYRGEEVIGGGEIVN